VQLLQLKQPQPAIDACTRASELQPESIEPLIQIAEAYLQLSEYDKGVQWYNKAQAKNQHDRRVIEGMAKAQRLLKAASRKDYYKILGLSKNAQPAEIRKAYRALALKWHPDKVESIEEKEVAESRFIDISEAYDVLSDEAKKQRYDNGEDVESPQQHHHGFPFGQQGFPFGGGGGNFQFHFQHG